MREYNKNMISKGIRLMPETWEACDSKVKELNLHSRNEFIRDAIQFYIDWLEHSDSAKFLTPELESVISGKLCDSENRLINLLFKLAVDQNYLAHLLGAALDNIDAEWLGSLRGECVREVCETHGHLNADEVIKKEHEEWQD